MGSKVLPLWRSPRVAAAGRVALTKVGTGVWRLSKLDIRGFKSFAEHSRLEFPAGITAVVGPNGCGKSNISDAIIWALGEQSTAALRAQRMKDVIFQGSAGRKLTGLAEVTLSLTRTRPAGLAGAVVPPVVEAALDHSEHAEQAEHIGDIERLDHGEQAPELAAESSNGDGDGNLSGSSSASTDVHREDEVDSEDQDEELTITRRLFRSGDSEYLLNGKRCLLRDVREHLLGTGLGSRTCFTIEQGRIDQLLSASPTERRGPIEEAAGISLYRRRRHSTNLKLAATEQDLARVQDICDEVARQMRSLKRQAGRARRYRSLRQQQRVLELEWYGRRIVQSRRDLEISAGALVAAREGAAHARDELEAVTRLHDTARSARRTRRQQEAGMRQTLYKHQVDHERARAEASRHRDRLAFAEQRQADVARKLETFVERDAEAAGVVSAREEAAQQAHSMVEAAREVLRDANDRVDPVEHLDVAVEGADPADPANSTDSPYGGDRTIKLPSLASQIRVDEEYRAAAALALGSLLRQPLLAEADIEPWLAAVAEQRGLSRGLRQPQRLAEAIAPDAAVLCALAQKVQGSGEAVEMIVEDLLTGTWVVESSDDVMRLVAEHPQAAFVDRRGTVWASGARVRARNEGRGQQYLTESVSAEQSLRVRTEPAADGDDDAEVAAPDLVLDVERQAARLALDRAEAGHRSAVAQAAAADRELRAARASASHVRADAERFHKDAMALERTLREASEGAQRADASAAAATVVAEKLERELEQVTVVDTAEEAELAGLQAAAAAARGKHDSTQQALSGYEVRAAEVRLGHQHLENEMREHLGEAAATLLRPTKPSIEPAEVEAWAPEEASEINLETSPEQEKQVALEREIAALGDSEIGERIADVRRRIDSLGPVNLIAYDDYQEQEVRFTDLDGQRRDLVNASGNLRAAISKIDDQCEERFDEAFQAIDGYFNRTMRELFGGGRAGMRLDNPSEPLDCGIEIYAQPPGKRLQNIRLLSGGERSMIALALMFAIFEYHPAPFCVLDEADAALDERNIGRFAVALRRFQERAQFIMITHNKQSMELADLLYGVTMEESGVSKLVSVQLS